MRAVAHQHHRHIAQCRDRKGTIKSENGVSDSPSHGRSVAAEQYATSRLHRQQVVAYASTVDFNVMIPGVAIAYARRGPTGRLRSGRLGMAITSLTQNQSISSRVNATAIARANRVSPAEGRRGSCNLRDRQWMRPPCHSRRRVVARASVCSAAADSRSRRRSHVTHVH